MIKLENNMLVLDSTFSKEDVKLINEFVLQAERRAEERIIKLLEIGGPIEQIICDYWSDPEFDKDDALVLIEKAIKGEK